MTDLHSSEQTGSQSLAVLWARGMVRLVLAGLYIGVPLLWGAGTLHWSRGWVLLALFGCTFAVNLTVMLTKNPALVEERWRRRKDTKRFDKVFGVIFLILCPALFAVAGMDAVRHGWTSMPGSLTLVGIALHVLGDIPVLWSFVANPHLETTVRIQTDRDHKVISDGPYRLVRHPMYVGVILMILGWPLILGSWIALGIACLLVALFVVRTALEDTTLRNELPGYLDLCERTRYRLIPGVW
jgi:protein-S-isoprenylcysteine O-methyltransferase Ste14